LGHTLERRPILYSPDLVRVRRVAMDRYTHFSQAPKRMKANGEKLAGRSKVSIFPSSVGVLYLVF
jgi:hypothetical protein